MSETNLGRWQVIIRRENHPTLYIPLPTLNDALEVSRTDAAWYGDHARVNVSPLCYSETKG